jgi:hypothetical protein
MSSSARRSKVEILDLVGSAVPVGAAGTGRMRYSAASNVFQVSNNGGAYANIVTGTGTGMAIGNTIGNGPNASSILFVGAAGVLAQNTNVVIDNTNTRVGIGNAAPTTALDVTGTTRTTNATITAMTQGSVLFAGASGAVSQNNARLFWNDAASQFCIGTNTALDSRHLTVVGTGVHLVGLQSTNAAGFSGAAFYDEGGAVRGGVGYSNGTDNLFFDLANTANGLLIASNGVGTQKWSFFPTGALQIHASAAPAVSAAGTVSLIVNGGVLQSSTNGAAYVPFISGTGTGMAIGNTVTSATAGSVLFAGAAGVLAQNNALLFWDTGNSQLLVGTNTPLALYRMLVQNSGTGSNVLQIQNNSADGFTSIVMTNNSGTFQSTFGWGNASVSVTHVRNLIFLFSASADFAMSNATRNEHLFGLTSGSCFHQMANGSSAAVSAAGTARLRYNSGTDRLQVSKNGAAYVDII